MSSIELDWVRQLNEIELTKKKKKSIEPKQTFDFQTRDLSKTGVENPKPDLGSSSYLSSEYSADAFCKWRNSTEIASDALWIVSFRCVGKRLPGMPLWCQGWQSFQGFKESRRERLCIPNCKKAQTIRSPSTLTGNFPVACRCFYNLVSEDVCKRSNRPGNSSNRNKLGIYKFASSG